MPSIHLSSLLPSWPLKLHSLAIFGIPPKVFLTSDFDVPWKVGTFENVLEMLCQEGSRNNFNLFAAVTRCNRKNVSARKINNEHFVQSVLNIFNYSYIIIRSSHQRPQSGDGDQCAKSVRNSSRERRKSRILS